MRSMTKSPLALAKEAFEVGRHGLSEYSSKFSRHDFVQAQHFAMLVLRQFFQADYRKMYQMALEWSDLRNVLQLTRVPHWTTLQKAEARLLKKGLSSACSALYSIEPSSAA